MTGNLPVRARAALLLLPLLGAATGAPPDLRSVVESGRVEILRWPDVRDYRRYLDAFYRERNDAPAWLRNGALTEQGVTLTHLFATADAKGVRAADYDGDRWPTHLNVLKGDPAQLDVALTATLMRYISDLHIGRVNPQRVDFLLDVGPKKYDLPKLVEALVNAPDLAARLETVEPPYDGYRRLRAALNRYIQLAREGDGTPVPAAKVEPGQTWEGVAPLAARLTHLGDLQGTVTGDLYAGALVDAVKRFQDRHGLAVDGRIGPGTLAALNVPLSRRAEQIRLSMERWRWAPSSFDAPPIVVNIPEFRLRAYDGKQNVGLTMPVVVGKSYPGKKTPVFAGSMTYLVFRPYWNVPPSIARKEIRPKMAADPGWAARNGYEVVDGRVRQKPGEKNALGRVKFMFPNPMNVYLHDTPSRDLFSRARRDFSHGCIRLQDPPALAAWVLRDDPKWTRERIDQAMRSGPQDAHVTLPHPIPVLLVYATAVAPEDGTVRFFEDIYGHDTTLEDALAEGYPYPW
ncbi:MAG TPA: L,D-transpeptidase family protein [Candidatus Polarisedimenticolaceae bacterium]|nr:L,D-transpeptidase family protein [Candidatus Polarisedimenticolaceae bacterium]